MSAPRLLIIYASTEGHTQSIAERIRLDAQERGFAVDTFPIEHVPEGILNEGHRAIILGSSIHVGRHHPALVEFARSHAKELAARPNGFFSVSLSAASHEPARRQEAQHYVEDLIAASGFHPQYRGVFGGALLYTQYGFLKRMLMKRIAKSGGLATDDHKDHVYTSWKAVDAFANQVLEAAQAHTVAA